MIWLTQNIKNAENHKETLYGGHAKRRTVNTKNTSGNIKFQSDKMLP